MARKKAEGETFEEWAKRNNYNSSENQRYLDLLQDAIDDAGPAATNKQISERMGL